MGFNSYSPSRTAKQIFMMILDGLSFPTALFLAFTLIQGNLAWSSLINYLPLYLFSAVLPILVFQRLGIYRTILLYMGLQAGILVLKGVTIVAVALVLFALATLGAEISRSIYPVFWMIALIFVGGVRFMAKLVQQNMIHNFRPKEPVIIYGAGSSGMQLAAALNNGAQFLPVAFVDDSPRLMGNTVNGMRVYGPDSIPELLNSYAIRQILLAIPSASHEERKKVLNKLEQYSVHVKTVPDLFDMVSGNVSVDEIRDIEIEDLLGRDAVPPDPELMGTCISNTAVMVTGAAGSIGSELCRQIIKLQPQTLVLFDNSEYGLYKIESELKEALVGMNAGRHTSIKSVLGSVRNRVQVISTLTNHNIKTLYHAAAYKQVPMVEHNIVEGTKNNIFGTLVLAEAAEKCRVDNVVLISTDKAVRPANIMGATKRFAEQILQAMDNRGSKTRFSMVRFGNVLGSSGSVVPLFRKQIKQGGPVTVTHPEVTRYFMTVQEAAQLVIQAGSMARGGDVFVLDMSEPVKIVDLAKKMVHLMGYMVKDEKNLEGDIAIEYTGLRPGEKLYEELLIGESVTGTEHPKILRAEEVYFSWEEINKFMVKLEQACTAMDDKQIRLILAEAIGGFHDRKTALANAYDQSQLEQEVLVQTRPKTQNISRLFPDNSD